MIEFVGLIFVISYFLGIFDESLYQKIERKRIERLKIAEWWNVELNKTEEYK